MYVSMSSPMLQIHISLRIVLPRQLSGAEPLHMLFVPPVLYLLRLVKVSCLIKGLLKCRFNNKADMAYKPFNFKPVQQWNLLPYYGSATPLLQKTNPLKQVPWR